MQGQYGRGSDVYEYRVCVADDCKDENMVLCEGLRLHNYNPIPAFTGAEVLSVCAEENVDLVLLDIGLPDIDGREVCKRLKENHKTMDIPVVFVTARGSDEDVREGFELGAVDYIAKPYNLPMVMISVGTAMRTRHLSRFLDTPPELIHDTVYTDQLTGLRNRRYLYERLEEEAAKAARYDFPLSCIMLDVDDVAGSDEDASAMLEDMLVEIAMAMRSNSRFYDILARYDGAQFAAVLPHAPQDDALQYARRIREELSAATFAEPALPSQADVSFGIVTCRNGAARSADQLLGEAMRNLLKASTQPGERLVATEVSR
jgi:diguanylate cyclase (GGDEF)-like protein